MGGVLTGMGSPEARVNRLANLGCILDLVKF